MNFITLAQLAQLARELDFTEKKTRRSLKRLIKNGKFTKGIHYDLDDYKDDFHFTYLVDAQAFLRETHLEEYAKEVQIKRKQSGSNRANKEEQSGSPAASPRQQSGSAMASQGEPSGSPLGTGSLPPATTLASPSVPETRKTADQEMIAFLKKTRS